MFTVTRFFTGHGCRYSVHKVNADYRNGYITWDRLAATRLAADLSAEGR